MRITDYRSLAKKGDWTDAFRAAVEAIDAAGGGVLTVPAGLYRSRSIKLCGNMTLDLQTGARLSFFEKPDGYPLIDMEFEGIPGKAAMPLIFADRAENIRVTGGGVLDGNGALWWQAAREKKLPFERPYLVCFRECRDVVLENVTLLNSPVWTVHPLRCENVSVRGVTIRNPADSPNTDGINPNSCRNVRISDCLIDVGDDCIAIKSGTEDTPEKRPTENVLISNCLMRNGHGGVVVGSEMSGDIRNVQVTGCVFQGTDRGIRVKTRRRRGGRIENLSFSDILMDGVMCPFVFNMHYFCGKDGKTRHVWDKKPYPVDEGTPRVSDIRISNVTAVNATACAGYAYGLSEMPISRLSFSDVTVSLIAGNPGLAAMMDGLEPMEAVGFYLRNVRDVSFQNVRIVGNHGMAVDRDASVTGDCEL